MKCLKCNNDQFVEKNIRFDSEVKGETIEVIAPCMTCSKCHSTLMTTEQMNNFRKISADKYREIHGLLMSSQIIAYRENLEMSQSIFARYLNVGEASIKRWETYYVQDASQDELIRLKCDNASAEMNFLNVCWKRAPEDLFNGKRKFNFQIMKNVVLYLTKHLKTSKLFLNKVLFYTDFLHFKNHQISLTGARYIPLKYGPCPDQYDAIYSMLINKGFLKESKNYIYECTQDPDLNLFDDNEIKTLEKIISTCEQLGLNKIYDLSHQEQGYSKTGECSFINYEFAKDLLI